MTKDDVIRMAQQTGLMKLGDWVLTDKHKWEMDNSFIEQEAIKFAALVAAAEREACAKICDERIAVYLQAATKHKEESASRERCEVRAYALGGASSAIRARGQ